MTPSASCPTQVLHESVPHLSQGGPTATCFAEHFPICPSQSNLIRSEGREAQGLGCAAVTSDDSRPRSLVDLSDAIFDKFPPHRKVVIVTLLCLCSFLASISSTTVLAATPELAAEFRTNGDVINLANALYMLGMAVSTLVWGPLSQACGRKVVRRVGTLLAQPKTDTGHPSQITQLTTILFCVSSLGTALAPNLAYFFIFRALTAFGGTAFILVGQASIG